MSERLSGRWGGVALAALAGVAASVQARINGGLAGRLHDGFAAALVSNGTALILLSVAVAFAPAARAGLRRVWSGLRGGSLKPWECLGGAGGALYVASQGLAAGPLGVAVFTVAVVTGQSGGGLAVDRAGLAPGGRRPVTGTRILGAVLTVAAVLLAVSGRAGLDTGSLLVILPLLAGIGLAVQGAINGRVRQAANANLPAVVVNSIVGTSALLAAFAVSVAVRGWPSGSPPAEPWLYLGGPLGICVLVLSVSAVRHLGALLLSLGMIAGQLAGAIALDVLAPGPAGRPTLTTFLGTALALIAVAIAVRARGSRA